MHVGDIVKLMPLGKIEVGDRFIVTPATFHRVEREPVQVEAYKVARVWIDLVKVGEEPNRINTWRMRRDTQDSGDRNYSQHNSQFYTQEQYDRLMLDKAVQRTLLAHRITIETQSPHFRDFEFQLALADWLTTNHS